MVFLDFADPEAVRRAASYPHAVLSWVGTDGYPVTVAGPFRADDDVVGIGPLAEGLQPAAGQEVCVTFSHIRPQPGVGYDQRRYVNLWGPAEPGAEEVTVRATSASGWDEADTARLKEQMLTKQPAASSSTG